MQDFSQWMHPEGLVKESYCCTMGLVQVTKMKNNYMPNEFDRRISNIAKRPPNGILVADQFLPILTCEG